MVLPVKLGKKFFIEALIDTGSKLNLVRANVLPFINYRNIEQPLPRIRAVNGKTFLPLQGIVCDLTYAQRTLKITAYVVDNISPPSS